MKFINGERSGGRFLLGPRKEGEKKRKQANKEEENAAAGFFKWAHEEKEDGSAKVKTRQT